MSQHQLAAALSATAAENCTLSRQRWDPWHIPFDRVFSPQEDDRGLFPRIWVGLLQVLARQGARLGGNTGQYFLRFLGRDGFMLSRGGSI
jgi:hypothetical protein